MIEIKEAINRLTKNVQVQEERIDCELLESVNCILYEDIYSNINVPDFPKSAMDGYAVRSQDTIGATKENSKNLKVLGKLHAGDYKNIEAEKNSAIRVMTGAYIPKGYDAVIKQELTDYGEETVEIYNEVGVFEHYCPVGEDIKKGQIIFKRGTKIKSIHLGILASLGISQVPIYKPMKVSLISTGSELIYPGEKLIAGKIYSSTNYIIASYINHNGMILDSISIEQDSIEYLGNKIIDKLEESDIMLTTGGVSVGDKDLMPEVMEYIGAEILFHSIAMKPGTPVMGALYNKKLIICFSGNPFASLANFHVLFWPVASFFYNSEDLLLKKFKVKIESGYLKPSRLTRYIRAKEEQGKAYLIDKVHESSVISNLVDCNFMLIQEPGKEILEGEEIEGFYLPVP